MIFETHAHYDDEVFNEDRGQLLAGLPEKGIGRVINVGASIETTKTTLALAEAYDYIYAAVGVHPSDIDGLNEETYSWLKEQTAQIKDEAGRKVLEDALDYVVNLATVSVGAMEQTTAKALRDAVKSGKAKPEELAALGKQVFDEVKAAISPQAQQVITDNLGSFDKYLTAVIEDAVLKVKQADPYITLSGELAEGVELPAAGGTQ